MCSRRTVLLAATFAVNLAFAVSLPCGDWEPTAHAAGKPEVVRNQIAVRHHGRDPVFVFGDANGDYAMLTSFTNLEVGLVFDTQPDATSDLGKLNAAILGGRAKGCYFLQGRDEARGRLNGAKTSKLAPLTCQ